MEEDHILGAKMLAMVFLALLGGGLLAAIMLGIVILFCI